jgi:hypothetical protein
MNKGGRPRKPVELHLAQGTYRPDRNGPLPQRLLGLSGSGSRCQSTSRRALT